MAQGRAQRKDKHTTNRDLTVHAEQLNEKATTEAEKFLENRLTEHHTEEGIKNTLIYMRNYNL